jgi:hypothetical protein
MNVAGGEPQPFSIHLPSGGRLSTHSLAPGCISKDGRIVLEMLNADLFFLHAGVIDPVTGKVDKVPVRFEGDIDYPAWVDDGKIAALGRQVGGAIWRFRPVVK